MSGNVWKNLQAFEQHEYRKDFKRRGTYLGHFSVPEFEATTTIATILSAKYSSKLCLDVGCGILPLPNYMGSGPTFYGIDPFFGEYEREFGFVQGIGEHLPFPSNTFDAVMFMSSLDHAIDPLQILREAKRVGGDVIVWTGLRSDADIAHWKKTGRNFDAFHQWGFSEKTLSELFAQVGLSIMSSTYLKGRAGKYPDTHLVEGR